MRIFSSREIVQQTRQKYRELPEIRQQQQMERDRKIRRSHRIMMDIFNKVRGHGHQQFGIVHGFFDRCFEWLINIFYCISFYIVVCVCDYMCKN